MLESLFESERCYSICLPKTFELTQQDYEINKFYLV